MRPTDYRDIPYMQSIDKVNVIYYDWLPDRFWDDCLLCGEYRLINHAVAFYEEPVHEEIGTKLWHGGEVGGMSCCKQCHDGHYTLTPSQPEGSERMTDIFVFGSNLAGIHGAGAARFAALYHGAIYGQGIGLQGQSYGIPTKDERIETLPLDRVAGYVNEFIEFARSRSDLTFYVTPIGCGLAGYKRPQIRPMFDDMPTNCRFAETWEDAE